MRRRSCHQRTAVSGLKCRIVAGGANDILDSESDAQLLAERGVLFVPDFVANSGGVIWVHGQRSGWDDVTNVAAIERIGGRVVELIERGHADRTTPVEAGRAKAREILESANSEGGSRRLATAGSAS